MTNIVINTVLGRVTRHPAGMHCPARDDAFVSSLCTASALHILPSLFTVTTVLRVRRLASALKHVYRTFRSSGGPRFSVLGLLRPHPCPSELTYIYNTILNFIWVSFCTAYIIVTFRVRIRISVKVRVRVSFRV